MCQPCLQGIVEDHMLDLVNDGEMTVDANGEFHPTPAFHARRAGEEE